jgi:hypothetical protein
MSILFLDTEFTGLEQGASLVSLALVDEQGRWLYLENEDLDLRGLGDWHQEHVVPFLWKGERQEMEYAGRDGFYERLPFQQFKRVINEWLEPYEQAEVWADAHAYDWVFFCELFGGAMGIPASLFYLPFDLVTLLKVRGIDPDKKREKLVPEWSASYSGGRHNALYDAFLLREVYKKIW